MVVKGAINTIMIALKNSSGDFVDGPTLATGDVKISKDGGAFANLTTLPTVSPSGSSNVAVVLSATECDADDIVVMFSDQAGAEWVDLRIEIETETPLLNQLVGTTKTVKQALGYSTTILNGLVSGANTDTETFTFDGYTVVVTVDSNGNRTAILYTDA